MGKILWTDEMKINLYQSDGKSKVRRREGTAQDPKHTPSSVKHGGGGVMVWLSKIPAHLSLLMI